MLLPPIRSWLTPGFDGPLRERLGMIGYDEGRVIAQDVAEAFAFGAGAEWMVE
ncbi:MAG TPA: hypothetical protein VGU64_05790 [Terriglobales bacterium]|nr:hypothetical protein [Terriglobales bacterium]